jgi:signal transduction histidine kinase
MMQTRAEIDAALLDPKPLSALVEAERVRLLFSRNGPPMAIGSVFALLLGWFLAHKGAVGIPPWLFLKLLVVGLRGLCHLAFNRNSATRQPQEWLRIYVCLLAADGLVWGAPVFLINPDDHVLLFTVMAAVVGVSSVGCLVLSMSFVATMVFCLCTVVPFALFQFSLGGMQNLFIAAGMSIFAVVVVFDALRADASTTELLQLRFQSADLLAQARLAHSAAAASSDAKTRFMAAISHEIRTPMHVLLGMLELLVKRETDPAKQSQLMATQKSGAHLLGLFNDVLDLSRIEAGALELKPATFDIRVAVDAVVTPYRAIAEGKGLTLPVEAPRTGDFSVFADEVRVRQILYNLLGNAISHTARGHVAIVLVITPVALEISVTDSGSGIPDGYQATIFEPFRQGPVTSRSEHAGSGLGLAISRQLAESMGGTLVLESSNQEGSSFKLSLPRHARA